MISDAEFNFLIAKYVNFPQYNCHGFAGEFRLALLISNIVVFFFSQCGDYILTKLKGNLNVNFKI